MASICTQESLDYRLGFFFFYHRKDCKSLEQTSQASGGVIILGMFKIMWIWQLRTWFKGEEGSGANLTIGLDDLKGLF